MLLNLVRVFDQNSSGAIDAPDPKSRPKKSAVRIKVVRPRHRMETIDRDSILAIKAVIGSITDSSSLEQLLSFHGKIKRLFLDFVRSPHADGIFVTQRELQCLIQPDVSPDGDGTFVFFRINKAAETIENAPVRISIKIERQPTDCKCFKISFLNLPRLNPDVRLGRLPSASTRIAEMNECENSGLFHLFW